MRRGLRFTAVVLTLAAVAMIAACRSTPDATTGERLERITLEPREARRPVGQVQHFTATGHYAGGATRNLTQRVEYTSSDPVIARAPNAKGERSRIEALSAGTVTISATDPKTGLSSHASGDDATLTVLGALERLTITPAAINRWVGQSQRLTVTGHYAGGTTRNLTQHVVYHSSDPAIVVAPNVDGDKSRVDAVSIGTATISAVDPATGITSRSGDGDARVAVTAPGSKPDPPR